MARLCAATALVCTGAAALRTKRAESELRAYSFDKFIEEHGRAYKTHSNEYAQRATLFEESLAQIATKNTRAGRLYTAGVHPFMDWTPDERKALNGYKPSRARAPGAAMLQLNTTFYGEAGDSFLAQGPPVRQQGDCGSCWAISAVEAVEAQLMKAGTPMQLSPQALLDCAPNPHHCGGNGGCDGATGEVAYSFMREYGIPAEADLSYQARTDSCPMGELGSTPYPSAQRVRLSGWNSLPSNQAQPLMQALVQEGPAVVAVDANDWFDYNNGIFDGCKKDAVLVHAVLAKGYGQENGHKYWQIQNSWGSSWGESGDIRIIRHDDEDNWCGVDKEPEKGLGCDGGPKEITVCGTCGILYDPIIPRGARIEGGDSDAVMAVVETPAAPASTAAPDPQPPKQDWLPGPQGLVEQPRRADSASADVPVQQPDDQVPAPQADFALPGPQGLVSQPQDSDPTFTDVSAASDSWTSTTTPSAAMSIIDAAIAGDSTAAPEPVSQADFVLPGPQGLDAAPQDATASSDSGPQLLRMLDAADWAPAPQDATASSGSADDMKKLFMFQMS